MTDPRVTADERGIIVTVSTRQCFCATRELNQPCPVHGFTDAGLRRATSGQNAIAAHRPTRYALMMRRVRANTVRKANGVQQLPAVLAGDCSTCDGLGVVGAERDRCPSCNGSGDR